MARSPPGKVERGKSKKEVSRDQNAHDEKPIRALDARAMLSSLGQSAGSMDLNSTEDLPPAEPLSASDAKDAEAIIVVFGEEVAQRIYSKLWNLRVAGVQQMVLAIPTKGSGGGRQLLAACVRVMLKCASDKMIQVFLASLAVLDALLAVPLGSLVPPSELLGSLTPLLEAWRNKLADGNQRVRAAAENALMALCAEPGVGAPAVMQQLLVKIEKREEKSERAWLGRLVLLAKVFPEFGAELGGYTEPALKMVKATLDSSSGAVRAAATEVAQQLYLLHGDLQSMAKQLADLKPALRDPLMASLEALQAESGGLPAHAEPVPVRGGRAPPRKSPPLTPSPRNVSPAPGGGDSPGASTGTSRRGSNDSKPAGSRRGSKTPPRAKTPPGGRAKTPPGGRAKTPPGPPPGPPPGAPPPGAAGAVYVDDEGNEYVDDGEYEGEGESDGDDLECQFCGIRNEEFADEERLDLHFWKECPLLTSCEQCGQVRARKLPRRRAACRAPPCSRCHPSCDRRWSRW